MNINEIDKYIKRYILAPYRIRILEARQDYDIGMKGKCRLKDTKEIDNLYNYMEKIESIINSDDLQKIEIFRLDNNTVLEEFNMSKHKAWNYRKRVRSKILEAINSGELLELK